MKTSLSLVSVSVIATLVVAVSFLRVERPSPAQPGPTPNAEGTKLLGRLPVAFVPNLGQWEHPAQYVARIGAMTMFLEEKGWSFTLVERTAAKGKDTASENQAARGAAVRMTFAGAGSPALVAEERLPGLHNYFLGNDPTQWRSDVPLYASVRYREMQPGVDVRAREHDGHFEYDLMLAPGADLDALEVVVEGIEGMQVDREGALVMQTALGPVRMPVPLSWEEGPSGEKSPVACHYVLGGKDRFGFVAPGRQPGWALVVDPGLVWSTFLGGGDSDRVGALAVDEAGVVTIGGETGSVNYPTTPGAWNTRHNSAPGWTDCFVSRLDPSRPAAQQLVYSTFVGGGDWDWVNALAVDAAGVVTITGDTASANYPTTPGAWRTTWVNGNFVTRLDPSLPASQQLLYSTYVGESAQSVALAVDAAGVITIAGTTQSGNYPTTPGAWDRTYDGNADAFVTRLDPSRLAAQQLVYSTFVGGANEDWVAALVVDRAGVVTISGRTDSPDYPTTPGAWDRVYHGNGDAFVTRLDPLRSAAQQLVYSTLVGGVNADAVRALAVDTAGVVTVVGRTNSPDYPTTPGAWDRTYHGNGDAFVTRLDPLRSAVQQLAYSTLLGGVDADDASALAVDAAGVVAIAGNTRSIDYPTTPGAWDRTYHGGMEAVVTRLDPSRPAVRQLVYSTTVGGADDDSAAELVLDARGMVTIGGWTRSADYPTTPGAWDTTFAGQWPHYDGFVTLLDMLPTGVAAFGRSSPGCTGPLAISVTSMPQVGNANFALTCGNAPPTTSGLLALTGNGFATPVVVLGAEVWVDPTLVFIQLPATSNSVGASEVALPIPNGRWLRGTRLFAQFFWAGPTSPPPCPPQGLSASNALEFTIQP